MMLISLLRVGESIRSNQLDECDSFNATLMRLDTKENNISMQLYSFVTVSSS